ncbi:bile acid:sodium symporter [Psychrobacter sp. HD31]|uniref:arsenic resistance protein n=1 Tax=Psychrobacter sp. HD31 TaxID=3112003 RepID=UPI003DA285DB
MIKEAFITSFLLLASIILGSLAGLTVEGIDVISNYVDYLILALIFLVFVDVPINKLKSVIKQPKALLVAWLTNFLILPFLGYGLTQLFLPNQPLVAIGLAVYFMSPCTDWFLGFTRMAKGNTALGSILLPINMLTQLMLYPFFVAWFSQNTIASISASDIFSTVTDWFIIPVLCAAMIKVISIKIPVLTSTLSMMTNWIIYALVFAIFAVNVHKIMDNLSIFAIVLMTVVAFFAISLVITETLARTMKLQRDNHILYTMTTTARNAPLMLGLTMIALPNEPLIYAALIIGMLIEFPFLTLQVLRFNATDALDKNDSVSAEASSKNNLTGESEPAIIAH